MSYSVTPEEGSWIAMGLQLCAEMDKRHREQGIRAYATGDTSKLWSVQHWVGYQQAQQEAAAQMRFPGAPEDWPTVLEMEEISARCAEREGAEDARD